MKCRNKIKKKNETTEEDGRGETRKASKRTRGSGRRSGGSGGGLVGTVICNSKKGDCDGHTEADVVDFKEMTIDNEYRKETRRRNETRGWQRVAGSCWGCGRKF